MTIDSWRAAVGGSWSRLLFYPGGLTALLLALLLALLWRRAGPSQQGDTHSGLGGWWSLPALAAPLLALSLVPLPAPTELRVRADLLSLLLLLEVPLLVAVLDALRAPALPRQADGAVYLTGLLTAAPILALVAASIAAFNGSLLVGVPAQSTPILVAAIVWSLALPPLLQIAPWGVPRPARRSLWLALELRRVGHLALVTLLWLPYWPQGLPGPLQLEQVREKASFVCTFALLALVLSLWQRLGRRGDMRRWGLLYFPLALALIAGLLLHSAEALQQRLQ